MPLSASQKFYILFYYLMEMSFVAIMLGVSSSNQSVLDAPYLFISFCMVLLLQFKNDLAFTKMKRGFLLLNLVLAVIIFVVKFSMVRSKVFDPSQFASADITMIGVSIAYLFYIASMLSSL